MAPKTVKVEASALIGGIFFSVVAVGSISSLRRICGHCLLFGKVLERRRILTNENSAWCVLCVVLGIVTSVLGGCLVLRLLSRKLRLMKNVIQGFLIVFCNILSLLMACTISMGFQVWCSSFTINRCSNSHVRDMDWKMFQPKGSSCGSSYSLLRHAEITSWIAFLFLGVALSCFMWRAFKDKEQLNT